MPPRGPPRCLRPGPQPRPPSVAPARPPRAQPCPTVSALPVMAARTSRRPRQLPLVQRQVVEVVQVVRLVAGAVRTLGTPRAVGRGLVGLGSFRGQDRYRGRRRTPPPPRAQPVPAR